MIHGGTDATGIDDSQTKCARAEFECCVHVFVAG